MTARRLLLAVLVVLVAATVGHAHVPFLEERDFSHRHPFTPELPHQSIAVYAWLESESDVDFYTFEIKRKMRFFAEVLVPVHPLYAKFRPSFALIGGGFPKAPASLPVTPHEGYGAIVVNDDPQTERPTFYERFGGKSYYRGPKLERDLEPGRYALVYWDPRHRKGDYVAVIGKQEIWRLKDIARAVRVTPLIRRGKELHLDAVEEE